MEKWTTFRSGACSRANDAEAALELAVSATLPFVKGRTYRNERMRDVDFRVHSASVKEDGIILLTGTWVTRTEKRFPVANDYLEVAHEHVGDWHAQP